MRNSLNLLARLLLPSLEKPQCKHYLGRLVTNVWHAAIRQPAPVLSPGALKLLVPVAFCFGGLGLSNLHLHRGAVPVPMLRARLFFDVLAARRSGDDSKLPGPFPILSGSVAGFGAGLGFGIAAVAVVAVGGRKRGFALDAAQHDQVDEAAIPALLGQVTARKRGCAGITCCSLRAARIPTRHPNALRPVTFMHLLRQLTARRVGTLGHLEVSASALFLQC